MSNASPLPAPAAENIIDFLFDMFATSGTREYMGEPVSMAMHMQQSAACAMADGAGDALVAAALLHDIGHFVGDYPIESLANGIDNHHEALGADFLALYFPPAVSEPVRLHVAAKRYLCAVDANYFAQLSPASINSLQVQGGPMNSAEIAAFEASPFHRDAVKIRAYDDDGKVAGLTIEAVDSYRQLLESLLEQGPGADSAGAG